MTGQPFVTNPVIKMILFFCGLTMAAAGLEILVLNTMHDRGLAWAVLGSILFFWGATMLMLLWLKHPEPESEKETTMK